VTKFCSKTKLEKKYFFFTKKIFPKLFKKKKQLEKINFGNIFFLVFRCGGQLWGEGDY
jgi:hypothetical protein